jgi:uncharacterized protein GlcG (DUF336 family)
MDQGDPRGNQEVQQMSQPTTRPTLSGPASRLMVDAAVAEASAMTVPVTVVVVDESGVTKEMLRMDGAPLVSVQTAVNKAYAAAAIGMPPDDFYSAIESDGAAITEFGTRPGLALIAGGLPVIVEQTVAGAIGVAGAMTATEDRPNRRGRDRKGHQVMSRALTDPNHLTADVARTSASTFSANTTSARCTRKE